MRPGIHPTALIGAPPEHRGFPYVGGLPILVSDARLAQGGLLPDGGDGITAGLAVAGVHGHLSCHRQGRGWVVCAAAALWGLFWLRAGLCGSGAWKALVGADGAVAAVSSACARVRAQRGRRDPSAPSAPLAVFPLNKAPRSVRIMFVSALLVHRLRHIARLPPSRVCRPGWSRGRLATRGPC